MIPLVRKALGFERVRLSATEKQTFAERARWMFADNKRGHAIAVAAAGATFALGKTRPNGRLRVTITVKVSEHERTPCEVSWVPHHASAPTALDVHFLAPEGLSVISDIDDTIRISHVRERAARSFTTSRPRRGSSMCRLPRFSRRTVSRRVRST